MITAGLVSFASSVAFLLTDFCLLTALYRLVLQDEIAQVASFKSQRTAPTDSTHPNKDGMNRIHFD